VTITESITTILYELVGKKKQQHSFRKPILASRAHRIIQGNSIPTQIDRSLWNAFRGSLRTDKLFEFLSIFKLNNNAINCVSDLTAPCLSTTSGSEDITFIFHLVFQSKQRYTAKFKASMWVKIQTFKTRSSGL
jgi:hypothetical protein